MWKQAGRFAAMGLEMGFAVGIGLIVGWYLDSRFGTEPVLFWVGFSLGIGAAAKAVFDGARAARKAMGKDGSSTPDED